jgi:hypothetical protein
MLSNYVEIWLRLTDRLVEILDNSSIDSGIQRLRAYLSVSPCAFGIHSLVTLEKMCSSLACSERHARGIVIHATVLTFNLHPAFSSMSGVWIVAFGIVFALIANVD